METLKIALVSDWFYPKVGGIENHIHELALNLLKKGHEPYVITHNQYNGVDGLSLNNYDKKFPYHVYRIPSFISIKNLGVSLGPDNLSKINILYKTLRFDITHSHSIFSPLSIVTAKLSSGVHGIPSVITNHSLIGDIKVGPESILTLRYLLNSVSIIIAVSRVVARDTLRITRKVPIRIIPNAIDTESWRPPDSYERENLRKKICSELSLEDCSNRIIVITSSRMTRKKHIHMLPVIAKKVIQLVFPKKPLFIVLGDGEYRGLVEKYTQELGMGEYIKILGFKPREHVKRYLQAADIYISLSPYEAFGLAVLEALATGLPVVAYSGGGVTDLVVNNVTGYLVRGPGEFAKKLATLINMEDTRLHMGHRARERAVRRFSWDKILPVIIDTYKHALDNGVRDKMFIFQFFDLIGGLVASSTNR